MDKIFEKSLNLEFITFEEALKIYKNASTTELMLIANNIKNKIHKNKIVGWQIDRNVNITNSCIAQCSFCNFYVNPKSDKVYITTIEQYKEKIDELYALGGNQVLLQGGLHPKLGLEFYTNLFKELKKLYPDLKLHALGPAEIHHISKLSKKTYKEVLIELINAGLDSLPGAGAEILSDRVRKTISKGKCNTQQWFDVMHEAHKLNLITSATMMFGHIETIEERIEHLIKIREGQNKKPQNSVGFISFIPWTFQDEGTNLQQNNHVYNTTTSENYIRLLAISRIILVNIKNIQASWLTVGASTAQICLHAGANDFGSIMIEENVVSAAGAEYSFNKDEIQKSITEAGFIPKLRNQKYEYLN
jgi:cyclic dehypoxanthinyl futalosine synthase